MGRFFQVLVQVVRRQARDRARTPRTGGTAQSCESPAKLRDLAHAVRSRHGRTPSRSDRSDKQTEAAATHLPGTGEPCRSGPGSTRRNLEAFCQPIPELRVAALIRVGSRSDYEVIARGIRQPAEADDLPQPSSQAIPFHSRASVTRHYDSHAWQCALSGSQKDVQRPAPLTATRTENIPDLIGSPKPAGTGKRTSVRHGQGARSRLSGGACGGLRR
jgi:hypothetical protein